MVIVPLFLASLIACRREPGPSLFAFTTANVLNNARVSSSAAYGTKAIRVRPWLGRTRRHAVQKILSKDCGSFKRRIERLLLMSLGKFDKLVGVEWQRKRRWCLLGEELHADTQELWSKGCLHVIGEKIPGGYGNSSHANLVPGNCVKGVLRLLAIERSI